MSANVAETEALQESVTALMRPVVPAVTRQLRLPTVIGKLLLDLRVREGSRWDATDEARRRVRAFWCPAGADVLLLVGAGLSPLPVLVDPILEREPRNVEVVGADDSTVGQWVQALRGVAGGGLR